MSSDGDLTGCHALLLGVGEYSDASIADLRTPARDVAALKSVLESEACGFTVDDVVDPDLREMRIAVTNALKRPEARLLVIFISGHGMISDGDQLFLASSDTSSDHVADTSFAASDLKAKIDNTSISQIVLMLDCCFAGAFAREFKGAADAESGWRSALGSGRGKYVIWSSKAYQRSIAETDVGLSPFAKWLVRGLESGEADQNRDGYVDVDELRDYLERNVREDTGEQVPGGAGYAKSGPIFIAKASLPKGAGSPAPRPELARLRALRNLFSVNEVIPFIGPGLFGTGKLGSFELARSILELAGISDEPGDSLATNCEQVFQVSESRAVFLGYLESALGAVSAESAATAMHRAIAREMTAGLVVSASSDWVLEQEFERAERPYTIVAHVINAIDASNEGQLIRVDRSPGSEGWKTSASFTLADDLLLNLEDETVIYKVLGAPKIARLLPRRSKETIAANVPASDVDTVVATETDYISLLSKMENQHSKVPSQFLRRISENTVVFVGYALDIWQYRLILNAFRDSFKRLYAVREPTSSLEELWWERLPATLVRLDPEKFAREVLEESDGAA
ncbi:MAG: caspase family protein [bacterium]|nr:caspase family protein [bacterium]